jgi:predicted permease
VLYIPLTFLTALTEQQSIFGDDAAKAKANAVANIGLYIILWEMFLWMFNFQRLQSSSKISDPNQVTPFEEQTPGGPTSAGEKEIKEPTPPFQINVAPEESEQQSLPGSSSSTPPERPSIDGPPQALLTSPQQLQKKKRPLHPLLRSFLHNILLNPPIVAVFLGLVVGTITELKKFLLIDPPFPLLLVIPYTLKFVSVATSPLALMIIGTNLAEKPSFGSMPKLGVILSIFSKLILQPVISFGFTIAMLESGIIPKTTTFFLVVLVQSCTPVSADIPLQVQLLGRGEKTTSAITFYQYITSLITLPLWTSLFIFIAFQKLELKPI